ncbi:hypothetical protein QR680_013537 [Steinernema hermaphroditum]|uniref:Zinc metalloproteinase n=1 Tax=Steinernema hermaphroditum TaxID=289476 RepID=A0AA39M2J1_9BILA|nr:hypothetical protein QR680_013537 [Steinernema hermaphroditum]
MHSPRLLCLLLGLLCALATASNGVVHFGDADVPLAARPRRSVASAPAQAETDLFGRSDSERQKVDFFLKKLNELADDRHPTPTDATQFEDLRKSLESFNRRQHDQDSAALNPEERGRHFEGDIVLTGDQAERLYKRALQHGNRVKRKFIGSAVRRWDPKKPIAYSFDGSHSKCPPNSLFADESPKPICIFAVDGAESFRYVSGVDDLDADVFGRRVQAAREQRVIELALEHWHNITCLNFVRRDDEPSGNRIVFTDVDGCASNVGRHPLGEAQFVSLAPECIRLGVIAHEVAHALGFWHEQSRPDRDAWVQVRWENIDRDSKGQFLKEQPSDVDNAGVPYDYGSIMHYRSKAFARYDDLFTMNTFIADYQRTIGQRDQLSFNDIRLMNKIYCRDSCPTQLPCQRGGYTDPRRCDRCRCPDGFTGQYCEQVMPGYGSDCGGRVEVSSVWSRITSPGYPAEFREGQECSWLLVAPKGQRVQFQFYGEFEMYCKVRHSLCMDYVEIRNSTDFANTGMRYCCFGTPTSSIISATEDMLVLFRSFYRGGKGFQAQVRAIPSAGAWSDWSLWSACSASCGACGVRKRSRACPPGDVCLGDRQETEVCNRAPCEGLCPRKRTEESECSGLLALIKTLKCRTEKVVMEKCKEKCCSGSELNPDGECVSTSG